MDSCSHLEQIKFHSAPNHACAECLAKGDSWVHLRLCTACGNVGCCDESKNRHATKHHKKTKHAIVRSLEPGEEWYYCYVDDFGFELARE